MSIKIYFANGALIDPEFERENAATVLMLQDEDEVLVSARSAWLVAFRSSLFEP
ncbi:MAG: hypothetical protein JO053_05525 [Acidobacteria bacterium]|nr:hypothetical protein [Acidobacteriota bacterium]